MITRTITIRNERFEYFDLLNIIEAYQSTDFFLIDHCIVRGVPVNQEEFHNELHRRTTANINFNNCTLQFVDTSFTLLP